MARNNNKQLRRTKNLTPAQLKRAAEFEARLAADRGAETTGYTAEEVAATYDTVEDFYPALLGDFSASRGDAEDYINPHESGL